MTKAVCPKCESDIATWRGGIAICPNTDCGWQGYYPKRVELLNLTAKRGDK
jgi:hypothetical protein